MEENNSPFIEVVDNEEQKNNNTVNDNLKKEKKIVEFKEEVEEFHEIDLNDINEKEIKTKNIEK